MIDFRYHLVSIASVFLALAVGIVLGAGPLRGTIGDTLASEVTRLREETNALRADLSLAQSQVDARDEAIAELRPRSVSGVLAGSTVGLLVLPDAADGSVDTAGAVLAEAGGTVLGPITVTEAWTSAEPPDVTARTEAAALLRELLAGELPVGLDPERVIDLSLARALAGAPDTGEEAQPTTPVDGGAVTDPGDPQTETVEDSTDEEILAILAEYGLLEVAEDADPGSAEAVVVVAPAGAASDASVVIGWVDLIGALDDAAAAVVAGDVTADSAIDTDLIAAIRDSGELADRISTIDNLATPSGSTAVPFAATEQLGGESGHYGEADTASGLLPPIETPTP
ncbi:copper transporter [Nostocoides sp. F2B08]|uniref:copper transporter n=1 Tax=Nostocoides sp. F2B08 TaxID=2653936 RepID=UPI00186B3080|nr:copper transporter [Tetrasphaera sp. F2B08]